MSFFFQLVTFFTYLPLLFAHPQPIIGVQIDGASTEYIHEYVIRGDLIKISLWWNNVESESGYNWAFYDNRMDALSDYNIIISVRNTPEMYRSSSLECAPPDYIYTQNMLNFIGLVANRYQPFALEFWNEPDVSEEDVGNLAKYMGCWGDNRKDGVRYGFALQRVYSIIKYNSPDTLVIGGAFMMLGSDFYLGAMQVANPNIWSYHSYSYYGADNEFLFEEKAKLLNAHTRRPLWLTETSLLCRNDCEAEFEDDQADYFEIVRYNTIDSNIRVIVWHELINSWMHCGMIEHGVPKPVYHVYITNNSRMK